MITENVYIRYNILLINNLDVTLIKYWLWTMTPKHRLPYRGISYSSGLHL
jgi:hypothetical protein